MLQQEEIIEENNNENNIIGSLQNQEVKITLPLSHCGYFLRRLKN